MSLEIEPNELAFPADATRSGHEAESLRLPDFSQGWSHRRGYGNRDAAMATTARQIWSCTGQMVVCMYQNGRMGRFVCSC